MKNLEKHFEPFRKNIIGIDGEYRSPYGIQKIIYADWIASGRLYGPIEDKIKNAFGPYVANTHTETSETGGLMTRAYHYAHETIKKHVNAGPNDVIITDGSGMTKVISKFQRILGLKTCCEMVRCKCVIGDKRPVVFITHMEHHSNHTSWLETNCEVVIVPPDRHLLVDPEQLKRLLEKYRDRPYKIGSFSACSNVTGIITPYHQLARLMHEYGGLCFVDFAASAPYVDINMHPADSMEKLDAIFFSPHKFLGGPGSSGVLIFDSSMYNRRVPDIPGGGTVDWTNPWGEYKYIDDIEAREDGGTPGFLQAFRIALAIELKNNMGVRNIREREEELVLTVFENLEKIPGIHILANNVRHRLGAVSFYIEDLHYNLVVKLLSDRFGVQVRGGCACAGTYGHFLLHVTREQSKAITDKINHGDLSSKPGWIRLSLHPTMTEAEIAFIISAIRSVAENGLKWGEDYSYNPHTNEFHHKIAPDHLSENLKEWFSL